MTTVPVDLDRPISHRFETLVQDLRYAARGIRARPGFALAVVLTLGLGVGANAAMFSIVDRLLFRAPPLLNTPELSHRIYLTYTTRGREFHGQSVNLGRYYDLKRWTTSFSRVSMYANNRLPVGVGTAATELPIGVVSAAFFDFFNSPAAMGRYFTPAEDSFPEAAPVAVLGYGYWQSNYGGRNVLGQPIQIAATTYTIIGVAPRGFVGLWPGSPPIAFISISSYGAEQGKVIMARNPGETWWGTYHWSWASMIAQRKPDVSLDRANADLTQALLRSQVAQDEHDNRTVKSTEPPPYGRAESILAERGPNQSSTSKVATWISGVAAFVWLIACANVANLFLARALKRRREIAVRLALGVSRMRLMAQLLTESMMLAAMGGLAGIIIAQWGGALLRTQLLRNTTPQSVVGDPRTLVFAGIVALIAGLLTGLAPMLQAGRADLTNDLKSGSREGSVHRSKARVGLLIFQGALSVVLLVGAGLFVRSLRNVETMPLGYNADPVLFVDLRMRGVNVDSVGQLALHRRLLDEATAIPGVLAVTQQVTMPFRSSWNNSITVPGVDSTDRLGSFFIQLGSPDYFKTMGTKILKGRGITEQDVQGSPLSMVVSEAMAKVLWPNEDPIGKCVKVGGGGPKGGKGPTVVPCTYVVGVAENIKTQSLSNDPGLMYYMPIAQNGAQQGGLFLRVSGDAGAMKETVRKRLQPLMPGAAYVNVQGLSDVLDNQTTAWRLGATLFTVFGGLALVLAAIGLYSVIAYSVAQRTQEMGIRVALGADMRDLVRLVLKEGLSLAAVGLVLGAAIAFAIGPKMKDLLFNVSPRDPMVFAGVTGVLLLVAVCASLIPARRAGHVDPMQALRTE